MRIALVLSALFALSACGRAPEQAAQGCARVATHEVNWTNAETPDLITTRSEGPDCAQAVVTWVARNAQGEALWAFASTYSDITAGGPPSPGAPSVSAEQMDSFLAGWANVTRTSTDDLPTWREGVPTLTQSAATFAYETPFDRETYEMLRTRHLPMICYASAAEATQCLVIDPATGAPTKMVAYGP